MKITEFTDQLIASYASVGGINHLDGTNLPSKSGIVSLTTDLLALLFPGFFDNKVTHSSEIKMETAKDEQLTKLRQRGAFLFPAFF